MKIEDKDKYFLIEVACQRTSLDYEITIYDSLEDDVDSDDNARSVDKDQEVSDTEEDTEQSYVD